MVGTSVGWGSDPGSGSHRMPRRRPSVPRLSDPSRDYSRLPDRDRGRRIEASMHHHRDCARHRGEAQTVTPSKMRPRPPGIAAPEDALDRVLRVSLLFRHVDRAICSICHASCLRRSAEGAGAGAGGAASGHGDGVGSVGAGVPAGGSEALHRGWGQRVRSVCFRAGGSAARLAGGCAGSGLCHAVLHDPSVGGGDAGDGAAAPEPEGGRPAGHRGARAGSPVPGGVAARGGAGAGAGGCVGGPGSAASPRGVVVGDA